MNAPKGRPLAGPATPDTGASTTEKAEVTVTNEITESTVPPISEQGAAAEALTALISMFGSLPGGYITIHRKYGASPVSLGLLMASPQAFEQWRTMLEIASSDVQLDSDDENVWLRAEGVFHGVVVDLRSHSIELPKTTSEPQAADQAVAVSA